MRKIIFSIIFVILFVIACAKEQTPAPTAQGTPTPPQAQATAEPTVNKGDPAVLKLFERNGQVKGYSFDVVEFPSKIATATYFVYGDKARVDPVGTITVGTQTLDVVYVDFTAKTATGYCTSSRNCADKNKAFPLNYADYDIVLPRDWISQIKYGEKTGSVTFDSKPVTRIKYQADGKYYEAYVDNYFGMPQRVAIATDAEMTKIVGGFEYRNMAFNSVKDTDVVRQTITT